MTGTLITAAFLVGLGCGWVLCLGSLPDLHLPEPLASERPVSLTCGPPAHDLPVTTPLIQPRRRWRS